VKNIQNLKVSRRLLFLLGEMATKQTPKDVTGSFGSPKNIRNTRMKRKQPRDNPIDPSSDSSVGGGGKTHTK